ncbi:PAS domain-containing protein [Sphingomonas sp. SM33]|uniref:histidine kinase n=1 Tax=Sphingomonas telluris TaxID=2907998 RepID=A0ABS9VPH1_9SPHN|nr:PAS domain-containing protein [Sphingomonas telluris]
MSSAISEALARAADQISFQQLADAMPQMVWSTQPDGAHDYYNAQWYAFTGAPEGSTDGEGWNGMFHPDDQERAWARWRHSLRTGEPYEIEYRLRHHSGEYRWTLGRALPVRDNDGHIVRWVGTCTDIHEQKQIGQQNEILSRELSHRIKNIFAVVNGLIGLSARQFPDMKSFARQMQARVAALGRAHDYVRPHSEDSARHEGPSTLHALLTELLLPYPALDEGRLTISGDDISVDDRSATPIGLVFHELATNSAKYGALSTPVGTVRLVSSIQDGRIRLSWEELGGPPILQEPDLQGFGTRLTDISVFQQLGGELVRDWRTEGLVVAIDLPAAALSRS